MGDLTLIHIGDLHGHLVPRPHLREDGTGGTEGGLARVATLVDRVRASRRRSLLVTTGDTIQGSAEALFTRGQALVDVVDRLRVDVFAPGNWDYLYGKDRFLELFGPGTGSPGATGPAERHRWGAVACNVYHAATSDLLLPPTGVVDAGGLRVGVVGLSSERAINALGPWVTEGIDFTGDAHEVAGHVDRLREQGVDLVVLVSEFGLAKNVLIAESVPGIDVVLSSDMHEETSQVVRTSTGALVSEVGQDGTRVGVLDLSVGPDGVTGWDYALHTVSEELPDDPEVAALVERVRAPFVAGPAFRPHRNPLNGAVLRRPIDDVVGRTRIPLHRSGFARGPAPAVVSGTSHDMIAAALREQTGADVGHLRGFRYGTHVAPGPVRLEDLYHYLPVGAQVGAGRVSGAQLRRLIENSAAGALDPDPWAWKGGWLHSLAGVSYDLDPGATGGSYASAVTVRRAGESEAGDLPLDPEATYTVAGYFYDRAAGKVGPLPAQGEAVDLLRLDDGGVLDATEVVARHLAEHEVTGAPDRVRLVAPLAAAAYGNPEIQPLSPEGSA